MTNITTVSALFRSSLLNSSLVSIGQDDGGGGGGGGGGCEDGEHFSATITADKGGIVRVTLMDNREGSGIVMGVDGLLFNKSGVITFVVVVVDEDNFGILIMLDTDMELKAQCSLSDRITGRPLPFTFDCLFREFTFVADFDDPAVDIIESGVVL